MLALGVSPNTGSCSVKWYQKLDGVSFALDVVAVVVKLWVKKPLDTVKEGTVDMWRGLRMWLYAPCL